MTASIIRARSEATKPIGYYVHHHGDGHRQRALSLAAIDPERFTLIGTGLSGRTKTVAALDLPDDRIINSPFDGADNESDRPLALHYAPVGHDGVRERMGAIAAWIAEHRPSLMIVDVSVEVALLARLCATAVAYVRLGGQRNDSPHLEAFRAARLLIAPFAEALDDPHVPDWIKRKTFYAPSLIPRCVDAEAQPGRILVVVGRGGSSIIAGDIIAAARVTPMQTWRVIGLPPLAKPLPGNVTFVGWSDDPQYEIACAEIVVGNAGDGLVSAVLAARRPFICIPEPRPFDEQVAKAAALARAGAALVHARWPADGEWPSLIEATRAFDLGAQADLDDPDGPANLMRALREIADRQK